MKNEDLGEPCISLRWVVSQSSMTIVSHSLEGGHSLPQCAIVLKGVTASPLLNALLPKMPLLIKFFVSSPHFFHSISFKTFHTFLITPANTSQPTSLIQHTNPLWNITLKTSKFWWNKTKLNPFAFFLFCYTILSDCFCYLEWLSSIKLWRKKKKDLCSNIYIWHNLNDKINTKTITLKKLITKSICSPPILLKRSTPVQNFKPFFLIYWIPLSERDK